MANNSNTQLALWSFGSPTETNAQYLRLNNRINEAGTIVGTGVGIIKRKELAKLTGKKGQELDVVELAITDDLKSAMAREFAGLTSDQKFTATRNPMRVSVNKDGKRRVTFSLIEIDRSNAGPSDDEVAKLLGITVEQVKKMKADALAKLNAAPIDVPSTSTPAPEA